MESSDGPELIMKELLTKKGHTCNVFVGTYRNKPVVIKQLSLHYAASAEQEWMIYQKLQKRVGQGAIGFPIAYCGQHSLKSGFYGDFHLVLSRLGRDIDSIHSAQSRRLSLKSVLMLGDQLLQRLAVFHKATGFKHNSVKGPNIMMGHGRTGQYIAHLIDYGGSVPLCDLGNEHERKRTTAWYRSWHHATCMDDVFSLGLNMVFWLTGSVPFGDSITDTTDVPPHEQRTYLRKRETLPLTMISSWKLPPRLQAFLQYARASRDKVPHYACMRRLLHDCAAAHKLKMDGDFEWLEEGPCRAYATKVGTPLPKRDACGCGCRCAMWML